MQKLDVQTIIVLLFFGNLLFACILTVFKSKTISKRLYQQFIAAKVLQSVAWLLLGLRGDIPDLFSVYFGNTFLSIGLAFEALALITVNKQSRQWEFFYSLITIIGIILMWAFSEKPNIRIFITSLNAAVIFSITSFVLIRSSFNSLLRKTTGIIYGILSIFLILRSVYAFFATESFGLYSPSLIQSLAFLTTFILMSVSGVGFQLILSEYNDHILDESQKMFRNSIELLPIGCIISDQQGNIKYLNSTFTKQFGYSINDIPDTNRWFEKAYPDPEYRKQVFDYWTSDIVRIKNLTDEPEPYVFNIRSKNGILHVIEFRQSYIGDLLMILLIDITERKKVEEQIKKLSIAIEQSPTAIVITDTDGNIEYANPKFTESTGYFVQDAIGNNPRILKSGKTDNNVYINLWQTIKLGKNWTGEFINKKKNGDEFIERALIAPVFDNNQNIINFIAIKEDITEKKQAEQLIKQQIEQLAELNATKDKFFGIIAHDLKNPFNGILGLSDLIVNSKQEYSLEKTRQYVKIIHESAKSAFNLLENLLEWSQAQTGKIDFEPINLKLKDLLLEVLSLLENLTNEKNISIKCEISESLNVFADKNMLNTVLRNLITNAIKFTNKNGKVTVTAIQLNKEIEITVSDTGVGMEKDTMNKLFKITEKVSTLGTEKEKGTGLGLLLCKEFVEKHNGKIWIESEVGKGSEFVFTIPLCND